MPRLLHLRGPHSLPPTPLPPAPSAAESRLPPPPCRPPQLTAPRAACSELPLAVPGAFGGKGGLRFGLAPSRHLRTLVEGGPRGHWPGAVRQGSGARTPGSQAPGTERQEVSGAWAVWGGRQRPAALDTWCWAPGPHRGEPPAPPAGLPGPSLRGPPCPAVPSCGSGSTLPLRGPRPERPCSRSGQRQELWWRHPRVAAQGALAEAQEWTGRSVPARSTVWTPKG